MILVNGRRLAPSGSTGTFTDVANIPITAIDHIDIISDAAAPLYGADAIAASSISLCATASRRPPLRP